MQQSGSKGKGGCGCCALCKHPIVAICLALRHAAVSQNEYCHFRSNDNDTIAAMPMTNYHHIGIQLRLYKEVGKEPRFSYPSVEESYRKYVGRLWENSVLTSLNLRYDHGDYRERVDKDKLFLIKYDLNNLYDDNSLTGFNAQEKQNVQRV